MNFETTNIIDTRNWVINYINDNCIYRVPPGQPPLPGKIPGTEYTWQFYLRRGLTNPIFLRSIGNLFWFQFNYLYKTHPFQVAGLETGATPLVVAIAMSAPDNFNSFIIRAKRKEYGLRNRFEGVVDYNLPVMLVDDMTNSKNTMVRASTYCRDENLSIYKYGFSIVNKDTAGTHPDTDKYMDENFKIFSLFRYNDFILNWDNYAEYQTWHKINAKPWAIERNCLLNTTSN